jgi:hypothetical protein
MLTRTTTPSAFKEMINIRSVHRFLEIPSATVRFFRKKVNSSDDWQQWGITLNKMEELLNKAGYRKVQETLWEG